MFKNFDWEDWWLSLLYMVIVVGVMTLILWATADKKTLRYSLGGDQNAVHIVKEIDWLQDEVIPLDRSVTYSEAIHMIDSLNATLKK